MSLSEFQRALCDLIASPERCLRWRSRPEDLLAEYDLSPRELRRIDSVIRQPGMSVNCTLYRVNRITPVYTLLPLTCFLLGSDLLPLMERFWSLPGATDLEFKSEIERFADFLRSQSDLAERPYVAEVLEFELALTEMQFMPRRRLRRELADAKDGAEAHGLGANPLVRVLRFQHDPIVLLQILADQVARPGELPAGEFYLLLDGRDEELAFTLLEPVLGRGLHALANGGDGRFASGEAETLIQTGLAVRSILP